MSSKQIRDAIKGSIAIGKGEQGPVGPVGPQGPIGDNNVCIGLSPTSEAEIWFDTNDDVSGEEIATKKFVEATNEELSSRLDNLIISNGDGNKDSELIDARDGEATLGNKIRKIDESLDNKANKEITNALQNQINNLVIESGGDSNLEVVQARDGWCILKDNLVNFKQSADVMETLYGQKELITNVYDSTTSFTNYNRIWLINAPIKKGIKKATFFVSDAQPCTLFLLRKIGLDSYKIVYKADSTPVDGIAEFFNINFNEELYFAFKGSVNYALGDIGQQSFYSTFLSNINDDTVVVDNWLSNQWFKYSIITYEDTDRIVKINEDISSLNNIRREITEELYDFVKLVDKGTDTGNSYTNHNRLWLINKPIRKSIKELTIYTKNYEDLNITPIDTFLYILEKGEADTFNIIKTFNNTPVNGISTFKDILVGKEFYIAIRGEVRNYPYNANQPPIYTVFYQNIINDIITVDTWDNNMWLKYELLAYEDRKIDELKEKIYNIETLFKDKNIVDCVGDSLTYGVGSDTGGVRGGYPIRLQAKLGQEWTVNNYGIGGETSSSIISRIGQGLIPYVQPNITIPSSGTSEEFKVISGDGVDCIWMDLLHQNAKVNPCYINDIKGTLKKGSANGYYTFTRETPGESLKIKRPTALVTDGSKIKGNILIAFFGQNDKDTNNTLGYDNLVKRYKLLLNEYKTDKYIFLGYSTGSYNTNGTDDRKDFEIKMKQEFGKHFISLREYMATPIYDTDGETLLTCYALDDLGLTPTDRELTKLLPYGYIPIDTITTDGIHGNSGYYDIIAKLIYNKGRELGYW